MSPEREAEVTHRKVLPLAGHNVQQVTAFNETLLSFLMPTAKARA
jgi:hypothetical protein